ncbi:MAG: hypothetical protein H5T74_03745 [Actinobacteria bacterium]|nr:hypothetical protein [Actinomycetota bacterium]
MEEDLRATDFVDYQAVFSDALLLVGRGSSVTEALEACIRERYPLTCRDIIAEACLILRRLKEEREWGSLRALRELADRQGLAEELRVRGFPHAGAQAGAHAEPAVADYPRVFALAQRKRQAGFSLEDSLDMAVRELYPQTHRKVREKALEYIRLAARSRNEHELRALRDLAEDANLFRSLETPAPD